MRFISAIFFALVISSAANAATDSLIVKGKILNFSGRLYRQGPTITFSRNNIFQPQAELSKQVEIQADGTFRTSLPLLYTQEEIYLDYSGLVFTTFLGAPGTVEITFNGDSLKTSQKLFYFDGINAQANNQYHQYLVNENKTFAAYPVLGSQFYTTFWEKTFLAAVQAAQQRSALRTTSLSQLADKNMVDPTLSFWIKSLSEDERLQNIYEFILANELPMESMLDSLKRLPKPPLTAQRVTMADRFGIYADRKMEEKNFQNPSKTRSLPVKLMATLIRNNVPTMTADEREKIEMIAENGIAEKVELDFLSKMYSKNEVVLNVLFNYERAVRTYGELFDASLVEFLKARYLTKNFYKYTPRQIMMLNAHMQTRIDVEHYKQSLAELVDLEVKDSAAITKVVNYKNLETAPREVLPGYWFSASNDRGTSWLNSILAKYAGKTVYLVKWGLTDEKSREELDYMPILRSQLPDDVVFLYLHGSFMDELSSGSDDLWKQYIVRHHLKGVHLSLNSTQVMDLLFKLNPMDAATFAIIKPNGKFYAKNAPSPSNTKKAIEAILEARK